MKLKINSRFKPLKSVNPAIPRLMAQEEGPETKVEAH